MSLLVLDNILHYEYNILTAIFGIYVIFLVVIILVSFSQISILSPFFSIIFNLIKKKELSVFKFVSQDFVKNLFFFRKLHYRSLFTIVIILILYLITVVYISLLNEATLISDFLLLQCLLVLSYKTKMICLHLLLLLFSLVMFVNFTFDYVFYHDYVFIRLPKKLEVFSNNNIDKKVDILHSFIRRYILFLPKVGYFCSLELFLIIFLNLLNFLFIDEFMGLQWFIGDIAKIYFDSAVNLYYALSENF